MGMSFHKVWQRLVEEEGMRGLEGNPAYRFHTGESPPDDEETFRRGLYTRGTRTPSKGGKPSTFWAELAHLASSNRAGLARLLGVKESVIKRWPQTIEKMQRRVAEMDDYEGGLKKPQLVNTGDSLPGLGHLKGTNGPPF